LVILVVFERNLLLSNLGAGSVDFKIAAKLFDLIFRFVYVLSV